jgi:fructose 1,6-bisphosphatase
MENSDITHAIAILAWESFQDIKDIREKCKKYENEIDLLKDQIGALIMQSKSK